MAAIVSSGSPAIRSSSSGFWALWISLIKRPAAALPICVLGVIAISAILAPLITPYSATEIGVGQPLQGPSLAHLFGTDELGRDLFSRVIEGGRLALRITGVATLIALTIGTLWACVAALFRGWVDDILMRIADAAMAIPFLLSALILVAAFGTNPWSISAVLGIISVPTTARVVRAAVLAELHRDYIAAARSYGASTRRLLFSELLPNITPTILVQGSVVAALSLLTEAALSFIGLGIQPPDASWGTLILDGYGNINSAPTQILFPGIMVFLTVWSVNGLAEQLQATLGSKNTVREVGI